MKFELRVTSSCLVDDGRLADALDCLEHGHLRLDPLQLRELVRLVGGVDLRDGGALVHPGGDVRDLPHGAYHVFRLLQRERGREGGRKSMSGFEA